MFSSVFSGSGCILLDGCSAIPFYSGGSYSEWGWKWLFLMCFPGLVLALPEGKYWKYLLFGWSYLHYFDTEYLGYRYPGSMSVDNTGWKLQKRLLAIESLLLLLWFLASGFALRMRNGGDSVTAIMRRTRNGRLSDWDAINCCILELYHVI